MANRLAPPNYFAPGPPNWSLALLDQNAQNVQGFANDSSLGFSNGPLLDTGSVNNYQVSCLYGSPSAYNNGMLIGFLPANTNTGPSSISVSPLGTVPIVTSTGNALSGGEIQSGLLTLLQFTASKAYMVGLCPLSYSNAAATGTLNVNCSGYSSVVVNLSMTGTVTLVLFNLATGMPVTIYATNATAAPVNLSINADTPAAVGFSYVLIVPGGGIGSVVNILAGAGALSIPPSQTRIMSGQALGITLFLT